MKSDAKDWFVMLLVAGIWIASTIYIFKHPDGGTFATWAALAATIGGIYHWLTIHDSKVPDCHCSGEDHADGPH
jgi:hypothetical protein